MDCGLRKVVQKGLFGILGLGVGVYAYILSMVKSCVCVENTPGVLHKHAPHRSTAIAVGEERTRTISGPLLIGTFLQTAPFLCDARPFVQRAP